MTSKVENSGIGKGISDKTQKVAMVRLIPDKIKFNLQKHERDERDVFFIVKQVPSHEICHESLCN